MLAAVPAAAQDPPDPPIFGPDVAVTKSGPEQAAAGSSVSYSITIANIGTEPGANVTLVDPLPAGMTFSTATQLDGPAFSCTTPDAGEPGTVSCSTATLLSGESASFTFVFVIPADAAPGTTFTNIATGNTQGDLNEENNAGIATTSTPPPAQADLGVTKSGPATAGPGTDVTYTIALANFGPGAASDVTLSDTLPGTTTLVSFTGSGTPMNCTTPAIGAGGTVTCTAATYPAGASSTFTLVVHVPSDTATGTTFANTATVTATTSDPNEENNSSTTNFTTSAVDLSVAKSGPASATAGDVISYTLSVANAGPDPAQNVDLTDVLPGNTTFVSLSQSGEAATCTTPLPNTHGTVTCNFLELAVGASAQFTLMIRLGDTTSAENTAVVTSDNFDLDSSDDTSTVTTAVTPLADLAVVKSGPATVTAGANATYTINVANHGPSSAANVSLTDTLPAGATFVSMTQTGGPTFTCGTTTCTRTTLAPGATATFTLVARISPSAASGSSATNAANVGSATNDPDPTDNNSSVVSTVATSADVSVTKSGPATVTAGANATYTIAVANGGPSDAANVSLTDTLPAGATFVSMTQTGGPAFTCGTTTCTIAALPAGSSATFTLVARISESAASGGSATNAANVSSTTPDPDGTDNSSSVVSTIATSADLSVTKSGPATVTPGTNATYTIAVANGGPSDASNVSLTDTLPAGATFVSMTQTGGPAFTCGTTTCSIATLPTGSSATFTLVARISPSAANGSSVTNTANVTSATPDPDGADNTATSTATAAGSADLAVLKAGPASVEAGMNITYSVTLSNNGPSDAANVTLSDPLPPGTTFVSSSQSGPPFTCDATIVCTAATMPAGSSTIFTFVLAVTPGAGPALSNTATVSSATPDPAPANASSTTSAAVTPQRTDVSIAKTANASRFAAGQPAVFTIVVTNLGPGAALDTTVNDVLPPGTTLTSSSSTHGTCSGTPAVTCTLGTLAANTSATITLTVTLPQTPAILTNTATVTISNADTNPANNTSTATLAVAENIPALSTLALGALAALLALTAMKVLR